MWRSTSWKSVFVLPKIHNGPDQTDAMNHVFFLEVCMTVTADIG
jgi:hypothetical protein